MVNKGKDWTHVNETWPIVNETYPMVPFEGQTGIIQASSGQVLSVLHGDGKNFSVNFEEIDIGLKGWLNIFF